MLSDVIFLQHISYPFTGKIEQRFDNLEHSQNEILSLLGKPENRLLPNQKNLSGILCHILIPFGMRTSLMRIFD